MIVTWNSSAFIAGCLESVRKLERRPEEIVVIDNASTDGTPAVVREQFPDVRLIEAGGTPASAVRTIWASATRRARSSSGAEPGHHARPAIPRRAAPGLRRSEGRHRRREAAPLSTASRSTRCGQMLGLSRQPIDRGFGKKDKGQFDEDDDLRRLRRRGAVYRRTMLDQIADGAGQYFDESFFAFYEDLDLAWRAQRAGWRAAYRHRAVGRHARRELPPWKVLGDSRRC